MGMSVSCEAVLVRHCRDCGVALDNKNWYEKYREKRMYVCKECRKRQHKEYLKELKYRAYMKLGGKCVYCGENDMDCLQIDHILNDGNRWRQRNIHNSKKIYLHILNNDVSGELQILCANHNQKKKLNGGILP